MNITRIDHIAIICSDYEVSKRFYCEALGFEVVQEVHREDRNSWKCDLKIGDRYQLELFSFLNPPKRLSYPEACGLRHLAFEVADLDAAVEELKSKVVQCEEVRFDETRDGKKYTFFYDPDGLPLELCEA